MGTIKSNASYWLVLKLVTMYPKWKIILGINMAKNWKKIILINNGQTYNWAKIDID